MFRNGWIGRPFFFFFLQTNLIDEISYTEICNSCNTVSQIHSGKEYIQVLSITSLVANLASVWAAPFASLQTNLACHLETSRKIILISSTMWPKLAFV
jgi:hypothetical protein